MTKPAHNKPEGASKPKGRRDWTNWQEDASRVKDRAAYKAKIQKIFNHECPECGGEKLAHIYVHTKECSKYDQSS